MVVEDTGEWVYWKDIEPLIKKAECQHLFEENPDSSNDFTCLKCGSVGRSIVKPWLIQKRKKMKKTEAKTIKYNLELTEEQLQTLSHACETCARINMLQLDMIAEHLGKGIIDDSFCEIRDIMDETAKQIREILPENRRRTESANILWDLYQVARHRLAWDQLKAQGKTKPDYYSVIYNEPFKTAKSPLAKVEKIK